MPKRKFRNSVPLTKLTSTVFCPHDVPTQFRPRCNRRHHSHQNTEKQLFFGTVKEKRSNTQQNKVDPTTFCYAPGKRTHSEMRENHRGYPRLFISNPHVKSCLYISSDKNASLCTAEDEEEKGEDEKNGYIQNEHLQKAKGKGVLRNALSLSSQWNVMLLINLAEKAIKHTEIRVHSFPEAVTFLKNQLHPSIRHRWALMFWVSGFSAKSKAMEFYHYWANRTRGTASRIAKGINLFYHFAEAEKLTLIVVPYTKTEQIWIFKRAEQSHKQSLLYCIRCHETQCRHMLLEENKNNHNNSDDDSSSSNLNNSAGNDYGNDDAGDPEVNAQKDDKLFIRNNENDDTYLPCSNNKTRELTTMECSWNHLLRSSFIPITLKDLYSIYGKYINKIT